MVSHNAQSRTVEQRGVGEIFDDPRSGYMFTKAIQAVKDAVRIEDVAAHYANPKLLGNGRLLARCIAPDHEDKTPSMTIYTDQQRFHCYGCGLFGDVVDMERIAGRHLEMWTAVIALAERYAVDLPRRPQRWHDWSGEKGRRHDALRAVRTKIYQRRFFRMFRDDLAGIEDPEEREAEAREVFANLYGVARQCAIEREHARG
jgi:DNA primase